MITISNLVVALIPVPVTMSCDELIVYSFFKLLTSFCPICSHIFKILNTISTTSVCCDHIISTICVVFTQHVVNYHVSKMLTFSFHTSLPKTKIMDLFSHI